MAAKVGRRSRRGSGLVQRMPRGVLDMAVVAAEDRREKWAAGRAVGSGIAVETAVDDKVRAMGEWEGCKLMEAPCRGMGPGLGVVSWGTSYEMCWLAVAVGEAVVGASVARLWLVVDA